MKIYDVIIIGAGPAGVIAALNIPKKKSILILEKGKNLEHRRNIISGWFGSGMYISEDLYFPVGKESGKIKGIFCDSINVRKSKKIIFPSNIGFLLAKYLFSSLSKNINVVFNTEVISINKNDENFTVNSSGKKFIGKKCILATGKYSAEWLKSLNIKCLENPIKIGMRVEIPIQNCNLDIENVYDIKTNLFIGGIETNVLSTITYNVPFQKSRKMSFLIGVETTDLENALRVAKIINVLSNDKIRIEKMSEHMEKSGLSHLDFYKEIYKILQILSKKIPLFTNYATIYSPEILFQGILEVDKFMKTNVKDLYGAGECVSGINNIIDAMISGITVSKTKE